MGLFDSVYVACPNCGVENELQSKADDDPYLNRYTVEDAPTHILIDVLNSPHYCGKCGSWFALIDPRFPPGDELPRPEPTAELLRDPGEGEWHGHDIHKELRWWDAPFSFVDLRKQRA
jgi:hypothetical protein